MKWVFFFARLRRSNVRLDEVADRKHTYICCRRPLGGEKNVRPEILRVFSKNCEHGTFGLVLG